MVALIDIDYFKRQPLGDKGTTNIPAEVIEEYIEEASQYVEDYLDRKIVAAARTERIVGNSRYTIILDEYPINSLIDISYDGYEGDLGTHALTDFLIHSQSGIIEWTNKRYNFRSDRVYTIQYVSGYVDIPGPIKRATALQTVQLMRPMYGGPQMDTPDIIPFADEMIINLLEKYRRKRLS